MSVDTLLIEIGCEDLPARYQRPPQPSTNAKE